MKAGGSSRKDGMLLYGEHYIVNLQYDRKTDGYRLGLIPRTVEKKLQEDSALQMEKTSSDGEGHSSCSNGDKSKGSMEAILKKVPGAEALQRLMKNGTLVFGMAIGALGAVGSAIAYGAPKHSLRRAAGNLLILSEAAVEGYLLSRIYGSDGKVFHYHGAEHKVINALENSRLQEVIEKKQPLITLEDARKASRVADRCGSNLIHYLTASQMAVQLVPFGNAALKSALSLTAGYKLFNMPEEDCPALKQPINVWGGMIQRILLTREPEEKILEGAVKAMNLLIRAENGTLEEEEKQQYLEEGRNIDAFLRMMC